MRLTSKGQVTIPIEIRERLGLRPGMRVEFAIEADAVQVRKASDEQSRGQQIVDRLRGRGDVVMSTDEIMALTRGE